MTFCFGNSRHTLPFQNKNGVVPYRRHHLFVEGEGDVCTVLLVVGVRSALGLHGLETGRPTLAHTRAGADETLVIQDRDAALPTGALTVPFVEQARSRATPHLEGAGEGEREQAAQDKHSLATPERR